MLIPWCNGLYGVKSDVQPDTSVALNKILEQHMKKQKTLKAHLLKKRRENSYLMQEMVHKHNIIVNLIFMTFSGLYISIDVKYK